MKNLKLYAATAIAAAMLASCASDEQEPQSSGPYPLTFKAAQAGSQSTRTQLQGTDEVVWSEGDSFTLFDAMGANNTFTMTGSAGTNESTFSGTVTSPTADYYALYPTTTEATISGNEISGAVLPSEQKAEPNNFDPKANLQVAHTTTNEILFYHAVAYLKFTVTEAYKTITFEGNNGEKVAGTIKIKVKANGDYDSYTVTSPKTKITLDVSSTPATGMDTGVSYLLALLPQTFSQGFTITCTSESGESVIYKHSAECQFAVGDLVDMGNIKRGSRWQVDLSLPANVEAVDLGLPSGTKWANMNVGATSPEEYGAYFDWAGTKEQDVYDWVHCPYQTQNTTKDTETKYLKYLNSTTSKYKDPSATDADALKTVLDPEDDAAHVNWKGSWRMPTKEEQDELRVNCYWQWVTTYNGKEVKGYIVYKAKQDTDKGKVNNSEISANYSVSDIHVFLPAAGYRTYGALYDVGSYGYYWSSSLSSSNLSRVYKLYFDSYFVNWNHNYRYFGDTVRPVCP